LDAFDIAWQPIQALPALSDPIIFNRFGVRFRTKTAAGLVSTTQISAGVIFDFVLL
jgi:hypothetical protein